jgi:hypothetical protein
MAPTRDYVSIREAAQILGANPWDVVNLIEAGTLTTVELVEAESLRAYQESQS